MIPLTAIVHRSRAYDGSEEQRKKDYMFASCLEISTGAMSKSLVPEIYRKELTDKLTLLVESHITEVMRNYTNSNAVHLGEKPDPEKQITYKPVLYNLPSEEYINLFDSALMGYKPLVVWKPEIIEPSKDEVWLPCPVILYF